jgi:hypothetical protein
MRILMSVPLRSHSPSASVVSTHLILQTLFMLLSFSLTSQNKTLTDLLRYEATLYANKSFWLHG